MTAAVSAQRLSSVGANWLYLGVPSMPPPWKVQRKRLVQALCSLARDCKVAAVRDDASRKHVEAMMVRDSVSLQSFDCWGPECSNINGENEKGSVQTLLILFTRRNYDYGILTVCCETSCRLFRQLHHLSSEIPQRRYKSFVT